MRIVLLLPDGRSLGFPDREALETALALGRDYSAAQAASQAATDEPLRSAEDAAPLLGVSARWLEDSARAGLVPHVQLGRFVRFRVSDVARHCARPGAPPPSEVEKAVAARFNGQKNRCGSTPNPLNGKGNARD